MSVLARWISVALLRGRGRVWKELVGRRSPHKQPKQRAGAHLWQSQCEAIIYLRHVTHSSPQVALLIHKSVRVTNCSSEIVGRDLV